MLGNRALVYPNQSGRLWKWSVSLYGSCVRDTWWGDSFTEDPEGYITEGSGNGHLSIWALLRNLVGGSFPEDFQRQMKEGSGNGAPPSVGVL
jgi:hypothetical protein